MSAQHKAGTETYTVNEICRKLGLSRLQVFELIRRNEFRAIHVKGCTRISKKSFDDWLHYFLPLKIVESNMNLKETDDFDTVFECITQEDYELRYGNGHMLVDLDY